MKSWKHGFFSRLRWLRKSVEVHPSAKLLKVCGFESINLLRGDSLESVGIAAGKTV